MLHLPGCLHQPPNFCPCLHTCPVASSLPHSSPENVKLAVAVLPAALQWPLTSFQNGPAWPSTTCLSGLPIPTRTNVLLAGRALIPAFIAAVASARNGLPQRGCPGRALKVSPGRARASPWWSRSPSPETQSWDPSPSGRIPALRTTTFGRKHHADPLTHALSLFLFILTFCRECF